MSMKRVLLSDGREAAEPVPPAAEETVDWEKVRQQFVLMPGMSYLNSGSEGSMPRTTLGHYSLYNQEWAANPSFSFFNSPRFGETQPVNRAAVAGFVGAPEADICLTNNTTMGLAIVLFGLSLQAGDEVVTSTNEHWSLISPLTVLARQVGIEIVQVPVPVPLADPEAVVEAFRNAITSKTRLLAFSHITWTTGTRLPVEQLGALAREHGLPSLVDGAHALGMIELDLAALGCDFYACSGHKWLNGPPGTGVLYIRDAVVNPWELEPILSDEAVVPSPGTPVSQLLQTRGCNNGPGFTAMVDSIAFAEAIGREAIEERILALAARAKKGVVATWGEAALFSPAPDRPGLSSGLTAFVPSSDPAKAQDQDFVNAVVSALWDQYRIYVRSSLFPAFPGEAGTTLYAIRASTNIFNDEAQVDELVARADEIARSIG